MRLTMLAAVVALAAGVAGADASTITVLEEHYKAVWRPLTFEASGLPVRCEVTLEGTFTQATFAKTVGNGMASVTAARVGACTGGTAQALTETLPWSLRYSSFGGALPAITSVTMTLVGAAFAITPSESSTCRAITTETSPGRAIAQRASVGEVTGLRMEESTTIPLRGPLLCEVSSGRLIGTANVTVPEEAEVTELMILLGEHGTSLGETGGGTAEPGISQLTIVEPAAEGTKGIENRSRHRDVTIENVAIVGENTERFVKNAISEECRNAFVLRKNRANACNVSIRYTGRREERPKTTTVKITYRTGITNERTFGQEFTVKAER